MLRIEGASLLRKSISFPGISARGTNSSRAASCGMWRRYPDLCFTKQWAMAKRHYFLERREAGIIQQFTSDNAHRRGDFYPGVLKALSGRRW